MSTRSCPTNFGAPWLALSAAFAFHILDGALTGFLHVYNPTVHILRQRLGWFPMPEFEYREWLVGLVIVCAALVCMTPFAYGAVRGLRPLAWILAVIMLLNGVGHTLFSVLGRTVPEVTFARPAPGFYSSPALLAASIWLIARLRVTAHQ